MISHYLALAAVLFAIGAWGVLARRNLLVVLMSLELMLNGANLALVSFALGHAGSGATPAPAAADGQVFVLVVMAVAAAEVAVGLAIVISAFRTRQSVDVADFRELQG